MDMHQKEQLHDNTMSMMQSQHFSVGLRWRILFFTPFLITVLDVLRGFLWCFCVLIYRWGGLLDSTLVEHIHLIALSNNNNMLHQLVVVVSPSHLETIRIFCIYMAQICFLHIQPIIPKYENLILQTFCFNVIRFSMKATWD